jgi:hypothetical protein
MSRTWTAAIPSRQSLLRHLKHLLGLIEQFEAGGRVGLGDGGAHQPGARSQIEHALDRPAGQELERRHGVAVEGVEGRDQPTPHRGVFRRVLRERA